MKKSVWIFLLASVTLVVAYCIFVAPWRGFWEATLHGPFPGYAFSGNITTSPSSVLTIPARGRLEVHELQSYTNPVVILRSPSGDILWSRLFIPDKKWQDGTVHHAGVRDLRLQNWQQRSTGSVIFVTCDWDWGGRESGLIFLDAEYEFKSFSLSW